MLLYSTFDWRSQECKEAKTSEALISQSFQSNLVYCLDLLVWWSSYSFHFEGFWPDLCISTVIYSWVTSGQKPLISSIQYSRGRTLLMWFLLKKSNNTGLYWDNYRLISLTLVVMIETTKLCILISVRMTLTFIHGHSCMRNQKLQCPNLGIDLDEI